MFLSCKTCDWSLNLSSILHSGTHGSPKEQEFITKIHELCCANVNLNKILKITLKRIAKCLRALKNMPVQPTKCDDTIQSVQESYHKLREYLHTNQIIEKIPEAKIEGTDKAHPHYYDNTFYFSSQLCDSTLKSVILLHECEPGHHYMNTKLGEMPKTAQGTPNIALIEGWGLYSERFFPSSEANEYAYCTTILIRCCRTVGDIMYNSGRWTEEQTKEFLEHYFPYKERISEEIKRLKGMPGYNVCYLVGEHFFVEMWAKHRKRFENLAEYHRALLECMRGMKDGCDFEKIKSCMSS